MKIYPPVKKAPYEFHSLAELKKLIAQRGQFFGEDKSGPACEFNSSYPCDKTLYEYMGWGLHKGLDIPCASGTEVYASHDGKVTRVSDDVTQGIGIVIWDSVQKIESVYWHLKSHSVTIGDGVVKGQLIALSDNTGFSKGDHLHFQINLTDENGKGSTAIDPWPHLVWFEEMKLTKNQVLAMQALEGYFDPIGAEYWSGKELEEYLKARVKDKIKQLEKYDD